MFIKDKEQLVRFLGDLLYDLYPGILFLFCLFTISKIALCQVFTIVR